MPVCDLVFNITSNITTNTKHNTTMFFNTTQNKCFSKKKKRVCGVSSLEKGFKKQKEILKRFFLSIPFDFPINNLLNHRANLRNIQRATTIHIKFRKYLLQRANLINLLDILFNVCTQHFQITTKLFD